MHRLVCLGLSHRTAPVELRERIGALGFSAERCPAVVEHATLQTCYRVELYARLTSGVEDARDELIDALSRAHAVERELLVDHLYVHAGDDVTQHLCRVAAGLDSLVLGETEILGQVGDALAAGEAAGTVGSGLSLLFRTATASSMALALAEGAVGDLRDRRLLVVGAGRIGLQSLKAAAGRGVTQVAIANRTRERATEVAQRFQATTYGLDELDDALSWADVAVTATASESPVVGAELVRAAIARRGDRSLILVDLAVPADVERAVGAIPHVRLFDVDDLRAGLDDSMASRLREVPAVEAIVADEVESFGRRYRELEVEPLLADLRRGAEAIRRRELERVLGDLGDIDPATAERIEHLSRTLVKRLLHEPTVRLRERAGAGDADEVADTVRELFGLVAPSDS